ncbi:MAG: type II toxin-antitoxin system VapC family toxin [Pseudonocardiaceae bacterium]
MIVFADSSALVKLYADEPDHEIIRKQGTLVVSALARVEVPAAIWCKHRIGELNPADAAILVAAFEADCHGSAPDQPCFGVVAATTIVLDVAASLVGVHGLRACDAVQLASAKAAAAAIPDCRTLAAFDSTLRAAAAKEGFALLPG